jgi:hypothetical protein
MSRIVKLAAAAIAIALTAAVVGIVAGHAAPRERSIRSDLSLKAPAPVVAGSVRGLPVQPQLPRYRLRLAPNVVELGPGPNCPYLTWRTIKTGGDAR